MPNNLAKLTNKSLDTVNFSTDYIFKIINNFNANKAHSHDMLSISMIKLCENSICKPLSIIFNDCLKESKMIGKKLVLYQSTRKEQCLKNYRPISLLQSAAKNWKYLVTILLEKITHLTLFFKGYFYFLGTPISRNTFQWLLQKTPTNRWISRNLDTR